MFRRHPVKFGVLIENLRQAFPDRVRRRKIQARSQLASLAYRALACYGRSESILEAKTLDSSVVTQAKAVLALLSKATRDAETFTEKSGLVCPPGCGACCRNPRVSTTTLEMLPVAVALLERGEAETVLDALEAPGDRLPLTERPTVISEQVCALFDAASGRCTQYATRPLVCRLFGSGARKNAEGRREFLGCRILREQQATIFSPAFDEALEHAPLAGEMLDALVGIDPRRAVEEQPINVALRNALERVLLDAAYR